MNDKRIFLPWETRHGAPSDRATHCNTKKLAGFAWVQTWWIIGLNLETRLFLIAVTKPRLYIAICLHFGRYVLGRCYWCGWTLAVGWSCLSFPEVVIESRSVGPPDDWRDYRRLMDIGTGTRNGFRWNLNILGSWYLIVIFDFDFKSMIS